MQPTTLSSRPPTTLEVLERIEAKLDRIERVLGPLSALGDVPAVIGTALETLDDRARGQEPELDARLRGAVALLERISRPGTLELLQKAVDGAESLPGLVATAVDAIDDAAGPAGLDLHGRVDAGRKLLAQLTHPKTLALLQHLLGHITDPTPVSTGVPALDAYAAQGVNMEQLTREGLQLIGQVVVFLRHAQATGERRLGLFGVAKALRDPHVQRAVGFAMSFLESFGKALDGTAPKKSLPA